MNQVAVQIVCIERAGRRGPGRFEEGKAAKRAPKPAVASFSSMFLIPPLKCAYV